MNATDLYNILASRFYEFKTPGAKRRKVVELVRGYILKNKCEEVPLEVLYKICKNHEDFKGSISHRYFTSVVREYWDTYTQDNGRIIVKCCEEKDDYRCY